jgi:phage shock protein PspC (stress-responsive transcriptional regulator)
MNKTVTVNLGGTVFHIDENAYEALIKYLNAIKMNFSTEDGRDEIMQDIESRISEMFRERITDVAQVITLADVEAVTAVMGRPEQFEDEESRAEAHTYAASSNLKRRLFRNPDDKLVGGVCSGLAAYLDIDPVWIRLAWALLFFLGGSGLLIYIILWIIIPEAKTTADKLQMRGEPVTVSSIGKNVKEEMESMKGRMSDGGKSAKSAVGRIFQAIGEVFKFLFIALGKIIAVFFLLLGLVVSFAMFASLFGLVGFSFVHYPSFLNHIFGSQAQFGWIWFGAVLLIGIPFLMLAYAGAKMLFNIKRSSRIVGFSALGLWLIGLGICLVLGARAAKDFSELDSFRKEIPLAAPANNILYLKTDKARNMEKKYDRDWDNEWDSDMKISTNGDSLYSRNVKLDIVKSPTDSFELVEIFYARGANRKVAIDHASHIKYSFAQVDSVLKFMHHFSMGRDDKWRAQKVQLLLRVPVGARVHFDESLDNIIYDIDNVQNIFDSDMLNRTWEMTEDGLSCVNCTGEENTISGHRIHINDDGHEVNIDDGGIHIHSSDGSDKVSIDEHGLHIRERGKDVVKIGKHGVQITTDTSKDEK